MFQDEVHGPIMNQIDKVYDLLTTKYATQSISYEGVSRVEHTSYPVAALREALLNAIAHRDYAIPVPIQVSVYPHQIIFWNPGQLPDRLSIDQLKQKHPSIPSNPDIANTLSRSGDIESWGRGTVKMIRECVDHQLLPPDFHLDMAGFGVKIVTNTRMLLKEQGLDDVLISIVEATLTEGKMTNERVQQLCEVSKATATRYLEKLEGQYFQRIGETGRGTYYKMKGS